MGGFLLREKKNQPTALPWKTSILFPLILLLGYVVFQGLPLPGLLGDLLLDSRNDYLLARVPDFPLGTDPLAELRTISFTPSITLTVGLFLILGCSIFLSAFNSVSTVQDLRIFSLVLVSGVFFLCFLSFVNLGFEGDGIFFVYPSDFTRREFGPLPNHEHFAGILLLVFPFSVYLIAQTEKRELRGLYIFFAIIILSALIYTTSRAAMVGVFLAGLITLIIGKWGYGLNLKIRHFLLPVIFLIGSLFFVNVGKFFKDVHSLFTPWDEMGFRFGLWRDFPAIFHQFPFLGTGAGSFPWIYPLVRTVGGWRTAFSPENIYLHILIEGGTVGFFLFFWFLVSLFYRTLARLRFRKNPAVISFTLSGMAGIIGILVYSLADFGLVVPALAFSLIAVGAVSYRATLVTEEAPVIKPGEGEPQSLPPIRRGSRAKGALLVAGIFLVFISLSQRVIVKGFHAHFTRTYLSEEYEEKRLSPYPLARVARVYRWLGRLGPQSLFRNQGELFFSFSQKRAFRITGGEVRQEAKFFAREGFEKCLQASPLDISCRTGLGWVFWEMQDLDTAEKLLRGVTGINKSDPDGFYNLGTFYYYNGNFTEAREQFIQLRKLSPGYRPQVVGERLRLLELLIL